MHSIAAPLSLLGRLVSSARSPLASPLASRVRAALIALVGLCLATAGSAEPTRLLRQPSLGAEDIAFIYGADLWLADRAGDNVRRLTSTPAVESDPHLSPDGRSVAFTSNRAGTPAVYVVPIEGGEPTRLTWYPAGAYVRGFTPDGEAVLYASTRETAPVGYQRLWTVPVAGGPSTLLPAPLAHDGWYSADGQLLVIDRISRWDSEWRNYRGGQNMALTVLDLDLLTETDLPHVGRSTDLQPVVLGDSIYYLSDRSGIMNVWAYDRETGDLRALTDFSGADIKWLTGHGETLVYERDGSLHLLDTNTGQSTALEIELRGDFPWTQERWQDVADSIQTASLSPTGKRALFQARGEIFTVPVEKGDTRNLTRSSGAADRAPIWSPDGSEIAWFSDDGDGYDLLIASQDAMSEPRRIDIGVSKMAWEPAWSPDGRYLAFVDDDVRIQVLELESGDITTADEAGTNLERGGMGITWSPDSKWLAYAKGYGNQMRRIVVWSLEDKTAHAITDVMADASDPAWDRDGRHLYLLASTDLGLASGWANTSQLGADPSYSPYLIVLRADDPTPFVPESDEEEVGSDDEAEESGTDGQADTESEKKKKTKKGPADEADSSNAKAKDTPEVRIDLDGIERRIVALPMPTSRYVTTAAGPKGSVFLAERGEGSPGLTLHRFTIEDREAKEFVSGVRGFAVSHDGNKMLVRQGQSWSVVGTTAPPSPGDGKIEVALEMKLDRATEWQQIFEEAWRYQRDFFYDPDLHGRDWQNVRERYEPLLPYVKHRDDLNYLLDQMNGELSVGHSFVFGGDLPEVEEPKVGTLGADLVVDNDHWKIERIYTFESWNPDIEAPLDRPGLEVEEGDYLLAINGSELTAGDDPYRLLDGTAGRQTRLHVGDTPNMEEARQIVVVPSSSESSLRQRAWVEDNRRRVDQLSNGRLAYVWVPNTSNAGVISFNRYFFAQQDKEGAIIDERFNGGGLLDDYMVDLVTRRLRAAITNETPTGRPLRLPAGILGPKVLLINQYAGSGGDFFPWVFRQQQAGPLIGARTWGGLVKSSVHYSLVDGGALTAPDNAVFDPVAGEWIGENIGIAPDIEVQLDALSHSQGRDPQLERGVEELLRMLETHPLPEVTPPPFPDPAVRAPDVE